MSLAFHTLVVLGPIGCKRGYLDVPVADAVQRFNDTEKWCITEPLTEEDASVIHFTDSFPLYEAWED